ncbi:MAG: methyltransferase [Bryobacteraceae bacterium]
MLRPIPGIGELSRVLASRGYTGETLVEQFGSEGSAYSEVRSLPRMRWLTSAGTPLDALTRLFLLGIGVDTEAAREALAPFPLDSVLEAGLLERCGAEVAAPVTLYPYGGLYLAVDQARTFRGGLPDVVMGISQSTVILDHMTIRRPCNRALDLGSGSGVHTLLAARHSREAYGVEISPRALEFARFNAALNGTENVRFFEGDFFAACGEGRFDLIVGNLPFVIAPARRYLYRDSGMPLDSLARAILREASGRLEPGGFCQIICQWVQLRGEDPQERLAGWLQGCGCDAWIVGASVDPPLRYAEQWIHETEANAGDAAVFDEWARYYQREGVEAIITGVITLRRSDAENWIEFADGNVAPDAGKLLLRNFELRDFERRLGDAELLRTRLRAGREARLAIQKALTDAGWRTVGILLRQTAGINYTGNLDANMAALLERCDGSRTVGEAAADLAAALGASPEAVATACVPVVRRLVGRGFLEPVP